MWGAGLCACAIVLATALFTFSLDRCLRTPAPSTLVLDRRGQYLGEIPGRDGRLGYWAMPRDLPERIVVATLQTEDRFFFEHPGVHLPSVLRALGQNISAGEIVSGASTIAMQVARLQSPADRTLWNKLREAAEAVLFVRDFGHQRVLRQYLTLAPYGNRVHGARRAARYYFDKPVEDLSWLQAAFLAGLPQAPGRMDPHDPAGHRRALNRAERILHSLHERSVISGVELEQAMASDLQLVPRPHRRPEAMHAVLRWSELARARPDAGPILRATLDLDAQAKAARILRGHLGRLRYRGAGNAACLVVDRQSGQVIAYVGSLNYFDEKSRGAIDYARARRPPGSALKPFIYALGIESGRFTAASQLADVQVEFERERGSTYRPHNISHTFLGPMLLREALANSRNIPALRVLAAVGVEPALELFDRAGVAEISYDPERYGLGLALGNLHVTLEELAGLYGVLANEGRSLPLVFFTDQEPGRGERLLSVETAQLITHILSDPLARQPSFPRGTALEYDYAVAVKTGTSQGYRDGWAAAYSDRLLVAVWVGNHDWRRMNRVGGLTGAGVAVHRIMNALMADHQPHRKVEELFATPEGYVARTICSLSGQLAGPDCPHRRVEYFAPGAEPVQPCQVHTHVAIDRRNGLRAGPGCPASEVEMRSVVDLPPIYATWARRARLEVAPARMSPLCRGEASGPEVRLRVTEPRDGSRYVFDPDTPTDYATVRLAAEVEPADRPIVWLVDGVPVARVDYPYEHRWSLSPGVHSIRAAMLNSRQVSEPVTIVVRD
ncbi:MAG: penicillin-binding protein 1C [Deltaproteobacteria bacterium]|nr:penicillin-binding protein 1C [Deltaproteobacteria bacterium]